MLYILYVHKIILNEFLLADVIDVHLKNCASCLYLDFKVGLFA